MSRKKTRTLHKPEFKAEALALQIGVPEAAEQLGLPSSRLYNWRLVAQRKARVSERESQPATENARLKRQLAEQAEELSILKKAATCFAKHQK